MSRKFDQLNLVNLAINGFQKTLSVEKYNKYKNNFKKRIHIQRSLGQGKNSEFFFLLNFTIIMDYTSIYLDDWPHVGAFTYRMRGFKNHTPKHYPKHYQLYLRRREKSSNINDFCSGDTKKHKIMMNLLTTFKQIYFNRQSNLAIMHFVENSHDSNNHLHWLDDEIADFLSNGFREHLFDDTIIFLYSDHGARFNKFRSSQRYLEERLPFVSVYLPDSFVSNNAQKVVNLRNNLAKLTSPFDIHATVRDLTCLEREHQGDRHRSISLFDKISIYRSCEDIGIAEHFCTCARDWKSANVTSADIKKAAEFAIESINSITKLKRDLCQNLRLKRIISAERLILDDKILYRVSVISSPNNGVYETIVYRGQYKRFEFFSDSFSIKSKNDLSRIDSYGEQPWCVSKFGSNPDYSGCFLLKHIHIIIHRIYNLFELGCEKKIFSKGSSKRQRLLLSPHGCNLIKICIITQ
ncbi:hypothetical protein BpHYR1_003501 [Brachionus plicatilis]|uniref:Uncharacterized protein n=1 Tax=Brachionus plicatilis TaxID=10195 RepID=A0A3M7RY20_BRAPC|nr:hypothetical protein BpHYR1_003501 [Brachionus plicatilis]